jgi:hypothetical protein
MGPDRSLAALNNLMLYIIITDDQIGSVGGLCRLGMSGKWNPLTYSSRVFLWFLLFASYLAVHGELPEYVQ